MADGNITRLDDSRDAHKDALATLQWQERGKRIGESVSVVAITVAGYYRSLLQVGIPDDFARELTFGFQASYVAHDMGCGCDEDGE